MTKFQKTMKKAETLQHIHDAVNTCMQWLITWEDMESLKPYDDEEERLKYEVFLEVFKALEKML